jgi:hypothetical protein
LVTDDESVASGADKTSREDERLARAIKRGEGRRRRQRER